MSAYDILATMPADDHGCIVWTRATTLGYGRIKVDGTLQMAHRVAYELFYGEVPAGLHLDHVCRNRACVNPLHLEPVSRRTNILRGVGPTAVNARKTHCVNGHDLSNAYRRAAGNRDCRVCANERNARRRQAVAA
jgi:hypothetical protein